MPCDTIRTVRVDIGKVNRDLLDKAAKAIEWRVLAGGRYQTREGYVVTVERDAVMMRGVTQEQAATFRNSLMRAYSKQIIGAAARQFGWTVQQTGPNSAVLGRS